MDSENYWKEIQLRAVIKASAPVAEERISYQIPTFTLKGNLVHFAAYKKHSGFYPTSSGIQAFKRAWPEAFTTASSNHFPATRRLCFALSFDEAVFFISPLAKQSS